MVMLFRLTAPNKPFERTPERAVPFGRVPGGAAQGQRYASLEQKMSLIAENLLHRIADGKCWLESGENLEFDGHAVRGFPTNVRLIEFLDDPNRIERNGLGFLVTVRSPKVARSFRLNVRVKTNTTEGPKETSGPYLVVYVVNPNTGADDEVICQNLTDPDIHATFADLTVRDWYVKWVNKALSQERGKFFAGPKYDRQDDA